MKHFPFAFLILIVFFFSCQNRKQEIPLQTPLEKSGYQTYTDNNSLITFLQLTVAGTNKMQLVIDTLDNGKLLPVVTFFGADQDGLRIMLLGQQHGNEPAGMEGLLMLIRDVAAGMYEPLEGISQLIILPQCNPYGADLHQRRNQEGIDLNRDHLLLQASETKIIQELFDSIRPHMTVDFHEYYPYSKSWEDFGYRRNFDIQLGGLTNINTSESFQTFFYSITMPFVKNQLLENQYSFFEYTLGNFALGERLRHSTVDINDGRQSFGIAGTYSMIVEGMNGKDSLQRIEQRAHSQYITARALLKHGMQHAGQIIGMVNEAREQLLQTGDRVSIRMDHFPSSQQLTYPLINVRTGVDTNFIVEDYHPVVKSLLSVEVPKAYLIPKSDTLLGAWLQRSGIPYLLQPPEEGRVYAYRIKGLNPSVDEELANLFPIVERVYLKNIQTNDYYYVLTSQLYRNRIITALEPQSMYGLASYETFAYLLLGEQFPILRLE